MMWLESSYEQLTYFILVLTCFWIGTKILRIVAEKNLQLVKNAIPLKEYVGSHHFVPGGLFFPLHCVICQLLILTPIGDASSGFHCTDCGLSTCDQRKCLKVAQKSHKCKEVTKDSGDVNESSDDTSGIRKHHWVKGNLPLLAECHVCGKCCSESPEESLQDVRCCWCQRTVHRNCLPKIVTDCDLGEFADFIIPPDLVHAVPMRMTYPKKWIINKVNMSTSDSWTPIIVIGNTKAGNNDGATYLNALRRLLNPTQVIDLSSRKMEEGLHWCNLIKTKCIILIAGGDGTIGWVLNTIDAMKLEIRPLITMLPLGTGNDLARTLGLGSGADTSTDVRTILRNIQKASRPTLLDRWKVTVTPRRPQRNFMKSTRVKNIFIQNYMSIGVDALVTYNFHKTRENQSIPFSGRLFNKLLYFIYGTKDVLERECQDLDQILELYMDGQRQELPNIESVVLLNIPCWGAGVRPWELGSGHANFPVPSICDGKLEVFCIYSSFHIAQMQVGLSEPHRIGQAKEVRIVLKGKAPMQTDGEPWIQDAAEINVTSHNKVETLMVNT